MMWDIEKALIVKLKEMFPDLEAVYLFGSRTSGEVSKNSDWDFAFLSRAGLKAEYNWHLRMELESDYDVDLDIIDLYAASTVLQMEVMKTGKLLWYKDKAVVDTFEYLTLSFYQKLNEERSQILEDIKSRGNIYG